MNKNELMVQFEKALNDMEPDAKRRITEMLQNGSDYKVLMSASVTTGKSTFKDALVDDDTELFEEKGQV